MYWVNKILKEYPPYSKDAGYHLKVFLNKYIKKGDELLDVGCGYDSYGSEYYDRASLKVGIDPDPKAIIMNNLFDRKYCCTLRSYPKEDFQKFDVIISQWVLEHVKNPKKEVRYIKKFLKPGGYFIFMTCNVCSPLMFISKILPTDFKRWFKKNFLKVDEREVYPTRYRFNTQSKLDRYFLKRGFKPVDLRHVDAITYFAFSKPSLYARIFVNRIFGKYKFLNLFRAHLVGVYQKSAKCRVPSAEKKI